MYKNEEKNSKTVVGFETEAEREGKFSGSELLYEVEPLLKEYFIGGFEIKDDGILMGFLNGQTFKLSIKEV